MSKNIVFITSSFPFGKSEVWAINEINSLIELGNNVIIVPRTGKGEIVNQDAMKFSSSLIDLPFFSWPILSSFLKTAVLENFLILRLLVGIIKQSNSLVDFLKGLAVLPKALFLSRILKSRKVDHIHSYSTTSTAVVAYIISVSLNVPWSYTLHSSSVLNSKYKRSFFFHTRSAAKCRVISHVISNDLSNFVGASLSKKINMVHLGVDIKGFKERKTTINDPLIIVTPAELKEHKGHIYAIDAAKKLIDAGEFNFKWYFYGSGPLLGDLRKKVEDLSLIDYCYFPGNIDHQELLNKYRNQEVDIVVSSSISVPDIFEGIPVSLMEAMSYEVPVIATDCGGTKELVDNHSGILIGQNDSDALLNAIVFLISNPEGRHRISTNGRIKITQEFDSMTNAKDLVKLF